MIRARVLAQETKVRGKPVHRGDLVEVDERMLRDAPWAFKVLEEESAEAPPPPGPALFEQLRQQDRSNDAAARSNIAARRRHLAAQHFGQAQQLLGWRQSPLTLLGRLAVLMGLGEDLDPDCFESMCARIDEGMLHLASLQQGLDEERAALSATRERAAKAEAELARLRAMTAEKPGAVPAAPEKPTAPAPAPERGRGGRGGNGAGTG